MSIQISKATSEDVNELIDLNYKLFLHDLPSDKYLFKDWPYSESGKSYFNKAVSDEKYCALVAKENDKVIGYLIGYIWNHWNSRPILIAEIDNMLVLDEYRGKGIGKSLIDEFRIWCKTKDVVDIFVMAYTQNKDALEFYKKNGFEDLSVRLHQSLE